MPPKHIQDSKSIMSDLVAFRKFVATPEHIQPRQNAVAAGVKNLWADVALKFLVLRAMLSCLAETTASH